MERQVIRALFFSCLLFGNVHNLQIETPRRLACEKPCGGNSVVRASLHAYCRVRVTLDDPPLDCKIDFKVDVLLEADVFI